MIEVLKQMIETLEYIDEGANNQGAHTGISWRDVSNKAQPAIQAGKRLIAELESQEPVAYLCENAVGHKYFRWKKPTSIYKPIALYTRPLQRTWVGLTDEEIASVANNNHPLNGIRSYARAIEAKLKEKNT